MDTITIEYNEKQGELSILNKQINDIYTNRCNMEYK